MSIQRINRIKEIFAKAKENWKPILKVASITANVTDRFGATSELSSAVQTK